MGDSSLLEAKILRLKTFLSGGVTPAMATPLDEGGRHINVEATELLVDFLLARGVRGLFVGGTTGEGILLPESERLRLHEVVLEAAAGRVPVLLHVGGTRLDSALELAQHAADSGADAMVAVTPIFYGMHDAALAAYYQALADAAPELPLFAYDIPHMAVNGISPALAGRLWAEVPSLAGLKSSHQNAQAVRRLLDGLPENRLLLVGNESVALGTLALGAQGLISGLSTAIPEPFVALTNAFAAGDLEGARKQQRIINQLLEKVPAGERIGAIKRILEERGVPAGPPTPPLPRVQASLWPAMQACMESHASSAL